MTHILDDRLLLSGQADSGLIFATLCPVWVVSLYHLYDTHTADSPGTIFTNSLDLRLDSRIGLDPDRVSLETRPGSKSSRIHKGKSSKLG